MVIAVGLGLGEIFTRYPQVHLVLKYLGAAYLLYLAWRIAQAGRPDGASADARPLTFFEAAAFQWVNSKAWMIALGAIPAFTTVGGNYHAELALIGYRLLCGVHPRQHHLVPVRGGHPAAHSLPRDGAHREPRPCGDCRAVRHPAVHLMRSGK
ncbi:MAG: LysE family translocator [Rhodomicrobiaceae bacterium]